jgi:hypothetical protein
LVGKRLNRMIYLKEGTDSRQKKSGLLSKTARSGFNESMLNGSKP